MQEPGPKIKQRQPVGIESNFVDLQKLKQRLSMFADRIELFGESALPDKGILMKVIPFTGMDYKALSKVRDHTRIGEYTIDSVTAGIDYKGRELKIKILDQELHSFVGKPIFELVNHVIKTYGGDYYIPGLEYMEYLYENPDCIPEEIKSGDYTFMFLGTTLCYQDGDFRVPTSAYGKSMFHSSSRNKEPHLYFNASALGNNNIFKSHQKVIIIEKQIPKNT